jgi:hypothetical protein
MKNTTNVEDIKKQLLVLLSNEFNLIKFTSKESKENKESKEIQKNNKNDISFVDITKMYSYVYIISLNLPNNDENIRWLCDTYNDTISHMYLLSKVNILTLNHLFAYPIKYGKVSKISSYKLNRIIANRRYLYIRFIEFLGYDILTDIKLLIAKTMIESYDDELIVS